MPKFDLPSYIANYKGDYILCYSRPSLTTLGRTVFRRLYLIASCSTALKEEAARLAVAEAKKGSDINAYNDALSLLNSVSSSKDAKDLGDPVWVAQQEKKNAADTKRMENELKQYKNNLIRESIRVRICTSQA